MKTQIALTIALLFYSLSAENCLPAGAVEASTEPKKVQQTGDDIANKKLANKKSANKKSASGKKSQISKLSESDVQTKKSTNIVTSDDIGEEVRGTLRNLAECINLGDATKLLSLWNPNATFINQDGESFQGKGQLQDYFNAAFKNRAADKIAIHLETVSFPAPHVAIATGDLTRKSGEAELPTSKISVVLVKENAGWLISEATETLIQNLKSHDQLLEMSWMIGNWRIEKPGESGSVEIKWTENHKFIEAKTIFKEPDNSELVDKQIIGWDPKTSSLVSWHFDCDGGFGYGKWDHNGEQWTLSFAGVSSQGKNTLAKNVFTRLNSNEFNWQSIEQSCDGEPIPDTSVMHLVKLPKNQ